MFIPIRNKGRVPWSDLLARGSLAGKRGATSCSPLLRDTRGTVARHQIINDLVEFLPRSLTIGMIPYDKRRPCIKLLILQMPPGEFRPDHIPGQFEELHA